jgi:hypothetical protein
VLLAFLMRQSECGMELRRETLCVVPCCRQTGALIRTVRREGCDDQRAARRDRTCRGRHVAVTVTCVHQEVEHGAVVPGGVRPPGRPDSYGGDDERHHRRAHAESLTHRVKRPRRAIQHREVGPAGVQEGVSTRVEVPAPTSLIERCTGSTEDSSRSEVTGSAWNQLSSLDAWMRYTAFQCRAAPSAIAAG